MECDNSAKPNKNVWYLNNWKPITLLNTYYKHLQKFIINEYQTGFIKDNTLGENIIVIVNILE